MQKLFGNQPVDKTIMNEQSNQQCGNLCQRPDCIEARRLATILRERMRRNNESTKRRYRLLKIKQNEKKDGLINRRKKRFLKGNKCATKEKKYGLPKENKDGLPKENKDGLPKEKSDDGLPKETEDTVKNEKKEIVKNEKKEIVKNEKKEIVEK